MPATSISQRRVMAIAEHHPDQLYDRNKGLLKMSKGQLHYFSATKEKGLPQKVGQDSGSRSRRSSALPPKPKVKT